MMRAWKTGVCLVVFACWVPVALADSAVGLKDDLQKKSSKEMLLEGGATAEEDYAGGAIAYERGQIVEAQGMFERAAAKGHAGAMARLGDIHERAGFVADAAELYRKAAKLGNADGQFSLGSMYLDLNSYNITTAIIKPDPVEARKWITLAAEQGHPQALAVLTAAYIEGGMGLSKEQRTNAAVLGWIKRGADAGISTSMDLLAKAYKVGSYGLKVDLKQAEEWAAKARKARGEEEEKKVQPAEQQKKKKKRI